VEKGMAQVGISQDWLDNLTRYAEQMQAQAHYDAEQNMRRLHHEVVEQARQTPGWMQLADQIEVWSADGMFWIGVRNQEFVSEAWLLEYGDDQRGPNPLFRTLGDQVGLVNERAMTAAIARYGTRMK